MNEKIKPIIIPAIIVALISCLIIVVYNFTYKDTSLEVTDKQAAAVVKIYGGEKSDFSVIPLEEYPDALLETDGSGAKVCKYPELTKIIQKNDGSLAFDMVVKGYKSGFDIMVGINEGAVAGIAVVSYNEETPGLGANNKDEAALIGAITGMTEEVSIAKPPKAENEVQPMTSATYSSKGIAKAVNLALKAFGEGFKAR